MKLYLTPSEGKTIEELSEAVGTTTKRVVTRSRAIGGNPFEGRSTSERTEESALLPPDEVRRMPLDDIVMVIDAQMPIRAKRIKYYEDRTFKKIHAAQTGALPYPTDAEANQRLARKVEALSTKLDTLAGTRGSTQKPETGDAATSQGRGGGVAEEKTGAAAKPEPSIALAQATPATGPVGVSARKAARLNGGIADMERQEGSRMAQRDSAGAATHAPENPTAADEAAIEVATNSLAALIAKGGNGPAEARPRRPSRRADPPTTKARPRGPFSFSLRRAFGSLDLLLHLLSRSRSRRAESHWQVGVEHGDFPALATQVLGGPL